MVSQEARHEPWKVDYVLKEQDKLRSFCLKRNYTLKDDSHLVGKTQTKQGNESRLRMVRIFSSYIA